MDSPELTRARRRAMRRNAQYLLTLDRDSGNPVSLAPADQRSQTWELQVRQRYWSAASRATWVFNETNRLRIAGSFATLKIWFMAEESYRQAARTFPGKETFAALGHFLATRGDGARTGPEAYERLNEARQWFEWAAKLGATDMYVEAAKQYEALAALAAEDRARFAQAAYVARNHPQYRERPAEEAAKYERLENEYRELAAAMRAARANQAYSPVAIAAHVKDLLDNNEIEKAIDFLRTAAGVHPRLEENLAALYAEQGDREQHDDAFERWIVSIPHDADHAVDRGVALVQYAASLIRLRDLEKATDLLQQASEIDIPDRNHSLRLTILQRLVSVYNERARQTPSEDGYTSSALHYLAIEAKERIAEVRAERLLLEKLSELKREAQAAGEDDEARQQAYFDAAHPIVVASLAAGNAFAIRHYAELYENNGQYDVAADIFEIGAQYGFPQFQDRAIANYRRAGLDGEADRAQQDAADGIEVPTRWTVQRWLWTREGQESFLGYYHGLPDAQADRHVRDMIADGHYLKPDIILYVTDVLEEAGYCTGEEVASVPLSEIRTRCPKMGPGMLICVGVALGNAGLQYNNDLNGDRARPADHDREAMPARAERQVVDSRTAGDDRAAGETSRHPGEGSRHPGEGSRHPGEGSRHQPATSQPAAADDTGQTQTEPDIIDVAHVSPPTVHAQLLRLRMSDPSDHDGGTPDKRMGTHEDTQSEGRSRRRTRQPQGPSARRAHEQPRPQYGDRLGRHRFRGTTTARDGRRRTVTPPDSPDAAASVDSPTETAPESQPSQRHTPTSPPPGQESPVPQPPGAGQFPGEVTGTQARGSALGD